MVLSIEERCKLWLSTAEVTAEQWARLKASYASATGVWEAFGADKERMFTQAQGRSLEAMRQPGAMEAYEARLTKLRVTLLFQESDAYPALLREIEDPPYVLYCAGSLSALEHPMMAVIGTRKPSGYGREMGRRIAKGLARAGITVVSGLAYGVDSCAHEGALEGGGATVAVLGSGINVPYPQEHVPLLRRIALSGGLAISEYPLDAKPVPQHFPYRNRIISGLSQGVVFVEGRIKSGGMITVTSALAQGREVFAVPGQVGTSGAEGPHAILREGARLATSPEDILEDLGLPWDAQAEEPTQEQEAASPAQQGIMEALRREDKTLDQLTAEIGLPPDMLMAELSVMEILGQVRRDAGNLFHLSLS